MEDYRYYRMIVIQTTAEMMRTHSQLGPQNWETTSTTTWILKISKKHFGELTW